MSARDTGDFLHLAGELAENGCECLTNRLVGVLLAVSINGCYCLTNYLAGVLLAVSINGC